jgi:amidase
LGSADEPEAFRDAPIALQLVGQSYDDEAVIAMTGIVTAALKAEGVHSKL